MESDKDLTIIETFFLNAQKDREDKDGSWDLIFTFPHEPEEVQLRAHTLVLKMVSQVFKGQFCGPLAR